MTLINSFVLIATVCASSAFALSFDSLELSTLISTRNLLFILGVLILGIAGFMCLNCSCCGEGACPAKASVSGGKKKKKQTDRDRVVSDDRKRSTANSSSSSVRKSPRKSKIVD